jgi:hypothetical protein
MRFRHPMFAGVVALVVAPIMPVVAQNVQPGGAALPAIPYRFKVAADHPGFEWFFLLIDAGRDQGIWAKHGLDPEFVRAAGPATELKERIDAGVKIGYVSTAEVTLAPSGK